MIHFVIYAIPAAPGQTLILRFGQCSDETHVPLQASAGEGLLVVDNQPSWDILSSKVDTSKTPPVVVS